MLKFIIITVLPVCFLLFYLYYQDKIKPEPKKKLVVCFGLGMLGGVVGGLIIELFSFIGLGSNYDSILFGDIISNAVVAAITSSIIYFILWIHSVRNVDFDEYIDGPVYATCIAFGYQVICDLFSISTDEWYLLGFFSIMTIITMYAVALIIGYYFSMAKFGKIELTSGNKFKMWAYPFLILWGYNMLVNWYNSSWLGYVIGIILYGVMAFFIYKKNYRILKELKELDNSATAIEKDDSLSING